MSSTQPFIDGLLVRSFVFSWWTHKDVGMEEGPHTHKWRPNPVALHQLLHRGSSCFHSNGPGVSGSALRRWGPPRPTPSSITGSLTAAAMGETVQETGGWQDARPTPAVARWPTNQSSPTTPPPSSSSQERERKEFKNEWERRGQWKGGGGGRGELHDGYQKVHRELQEEKDQEESETQSR